MKASRRNWIRQIGLGVAGLSLSPLQAFTFAAENSKEEPPEILLRSNENPYGPSPLASKAMAEKISSCNRYCWDLDAQLMSAIARKHGLTSDNTLIGAGSTEILDTALKFAALQKGNIILAEPTYDYWTEPAERLGLKKVTIPLTADKRHDLSAMLRAVTPATRLIYVCNPNNPTGTLCEPGDILSFAREAAKKTLVVIDEAYMDFTDQPSIVPEAVKMKNVVVARTFSKIYGMAGARIGYGIAHPATIDSLAKIQSSPNGSVGVVSVTGALAALTDENFINNTRKLNNEVRSYTIEQLQQLNIPCIPSHTNFIYFSLANYDKDYFERLKSNQIIGTRFYEEQGKWSRITVGTKEEMQQFIRAIS